MADHLDPIEVGEVSDNAALGRGDVGGFHEEAAGIDHDLARAVGAMTLGAATRVEQVFAAFKRGWAGGGRDRLDVQCYDAVELVPAAELGISDSGGGEGDNNSDDPQDGFENFLHGGAPQTMHSQTAPARQSRRT
jgi:hypothetical protein